MFKKNFIYRSNGFTLLEMLVVLVLVSLITTLIFEGFSYTLHLRTRFLEQLDEAQRGAICEYWFRSTIAGVVTDYRNGKNIFKGKEQELGGLTQAALDMKTGVPTPFAWQLQYTDGITKLRYQNSRGKYWEVARWLGKQGHFQYMAQDGEWHTQWPPQFGQTVPQIPRVILLQGKKQQTLFTWIVKLTDLDQTKYDYRLYE